MTNVQNTVRVHASKFCFLRNNHTTVHDNNYLFFEHKWKRVEKFQEHNYIINTTNLIHTSLSLTLH
jgi:hypothetical protein